MNKTIMMTASFLAVLSLLIVGCTIPLATEKKVPASGEISSGESAVAEAASELDDLDTLDELDSELDELDWSEAEDAVR